MARKIEVRSLGILARLYRFAGGMPSGSSNIDMGAPIVRVHDVSRQAELGSRGLDAQGYLTLTHSLVHSGAGTEYASTDVYAALNADLTKDFASTGDSQDRLWLMNVYANILSGQAGSFDRCRTGLLYTTPVETVQLMAGYLAKVDPLANGGPIPLAVGDGANDVGRQPLATDNPVLIPPGTLWQTVSVSGGAMTTRVSTLWWAGALGTTPPGMN